jgi:hypothetical protein
LESERVDVLNACIGIVTEILDESEDRIRLKAEADGGARRAIGYPPLCGPIRAGDRVLMNVTATDLRLGTGGWDFVIANLSRLEERQTYGAPTDGHLMKLRYAPQQFAVQAAEEAFPDLPETLDGRPVVIMELHSQIAPALIGLQKALEAAGAGYPRVAYLMPDAAALPMALSETAPMLKERGLIHVTVSCGHAFGGDYEAVNLGSGMAVGAGPARGDVLLVAQGPGNAGTASALGFGGLFQAEAAHLAFALEGDPILAIRRSDAESRPRHRGISHHTRTLLERVLLVPVTLPVPEETRRFVPGEAKSNEEESLVNGPVPSRRIGIAHPVEYVPSDLLLDALRASGLTFSSMGRDLEADPAFFLAAAAAGWTAGKHHLRRVRHLKEPK